MNQVSKPNPDADNADTTSPEARRRAAMDELLAQFRVISAEAKERGLSMTQAEIDEEMALYKAERRR